MPRYPGPVVPPHGIAPVPRRLRAVLAGAEVFDTEDAHYVWEFAYYPQYYVPLADVEPSLLIDEQRSESTPRGNAAVFGLRVGEVTRPRAVQVYCDDAPEPIRQTARFDWAALDQWFEEDEPVHVHARNPYVRVDALRSNRAVRVELDGTVLAEGSSAVMVFETGLGPRYYLDRTALRLEHLVCSDTVSSCPYKGTTTQYWSVRIGDQVHADLAWSYAFPTRQLLPIAGLVAFYQEKLDLFLDGRRQPR